MSFKHPIGFISMSAPERAVIRAGEVAGAPGRVVAGFGRRTKLPEPLNYEFDEDVPALSVGPSVGHIAQLTEVDEDKSARQAVEGTREIECELCGSDHADDEFCPPPCDRRYVAADPQPEDAFDVPREEAADIKEWTTMSEAIRKADHAHLPTGSEERKGVPVATGVIDYFPDALVAVAELSRIGNDKHNPGQPLHWARGKSDDHPDCLLRHFIERGTIDTDGVRHSVKVAWRALAILQLEIEAARKA